MKLFIDYNHSLELRQYENDLIESRCVFVLKLPHFFTTYCEGKCVAISKLIACKSIRFVCTNIHRFAGYKYIWTLSSRSYIFLALDNLASFDLNNLKQFVYQRTLLWSNYSIRKSSVSIYEIPVL